MDHRAVMNLQSNRCTLCGQVLRVPDHADPYPPWVTDEARADLYDAQRKAGRGR